MLFTNISGRPVDIPQDVRSMKRPKVSTCLSGSIPISWNYYDWVRDFLIWQIFGWPIDTTLAMARLVYGGVLEKFPKVEVHYSSRGRDDALPDRAGDRHV